MFRGNCPLSKESPLTTNIACQPLFAKTRTKHTTFSLTHWDVGFVWTSAPPVTVRQLKFLASQLVSYRYFPYTSFLITSTGLISERHVTMEVNACINEPLLAQICKLLCFGCVTALILRDMILPKTSTSKIVFWLSSKTCHGGFEPTLLRPKTGVLTITLMSIVLYPANPVRCAS